MRVAYVSEGLFIFDQFSCAAGCSVIAEAVRFGPYVPVVERRRKAAKKLAKMGEDSKSVAPVVVAGRRIAKSREYAVNDSHLGQERYSYVW